MNINNKYLLILIITSSLSFLTIFADSSPIISENSNGNFTNTIFENETNEINSTHYSTLNNAVASLDISQIPAGSQIESVITNIFVNGNNNDVCSIFLIDKIQTIKVISNNTFSCYGFKTIEFNKMGIFALQNNIRINSLNMIIMNKNNQPVYFSNVKFAVKYVEPTYYAHINKNNIVDNVIVADQSFINNQTGTWIETKPDGSIRGNFAGIGDTYNSSIDKFIPIQPYPSWVLNSTWKWNSPIPYPSDGNSYSWNETTKTWIKLS